MLRALMRTVVALGGAALVVAAGCGDGDGTYGGDSGGAPPLAAGAGGEESSGAAGASGGSAGDESGGAGGDESAGAGGVESGASGGGSGEAGASAQGGAGTAGDAGAGGAASDDCAVGRRVQAVFDDTGGALALCGAALTMPAGVLEEPRTVSLSVVALPPESPTWLDQ